MTELLSLIKQAKNGDKAAMDGIIERYMPLISKYSFDINSEFSEDYRQHLIVKLICAIRRFQPMYSKQFNNRLNR